MCNHCPYVKAVIQRLIDLQQEVLAQGVRLIGINCNDAIKYPDDSFESMRIVSKKWGINFPYLFDESQDVAKQYDAKFIYTVGGYHTTRKFGKSPTTYVTTTSQELLKLVQNLGIETTPTESVITGFNGLILGYAKLNEINGIGLYGELLEPRIPQYRAAKTILETLEKLTYQKLGDLSELDMKAEAIENRFKSDKYSNDI